MKKSTSILLSIFLGSFLISFGENDKNSQKGTPEIRNIIFMIGDGMGLPAVYAAMSVSAYPLNFERCTYTGMQKTYSLDNYITDSGAAGTALASGKKTNNGVIGQGPQGTQYKSILEIAEEHGLATGLVATSTITHATPASFIAHEAKRDNYEAIALDFLNTDIDVFIGG
jgi:alkaline phosphatase